MKISSRIGLVSGLVVCLSCGPKSNNSGIDSAAEVANPARQHKYVGDLRINTSLEYRYLTKKSESEGIADMVRAMQEATVEEEWLYFSKNSLFVEIGSRETYASTTTDLSGLEGLLEEQANGGNIIFYHIHPTKNIGSLAEEELRKGGFVKGAIPDSTYREYKRFVTDHGRLLTGIPSQEDVFGMIIEMREHKDLIATVRYKVCSFAGITEYSLTPEGADFFSKASELEIKEYSVVQHERAGKFFLEITKKPDYKYSPEIMFSLAKYASDKFVMFKFVPHTTPIIQN